VRASNKFIFNIAAKFRWSAPRLSFLIIFDAKDNEDQHTMRESDTALHDDEALNDWRRVA
jgi:hypothetical protein